MVALLETRDDCHLIVSIRGGSRRIKKDALWEEVKLNFYFPEGKEPFVWVMEKMDSSWRGNKSDLKVAHFDERTHDDAIEHRPKQIPEEKWKKLVAFWESSKGKERTKRGI